jgi:hypothetical protein
MKTRKMSPATMAVLIIRHNEIAKVRGNFHFSSLLHKGNNKSEKRIANEIKMRISCKMYIHQTRIDTIRSPITSLAA